MNKTELICSIAEKTELPKTAIGSTLDAALEAITEALASGDKVQLVGFGAFEVKTRAERIGRNPKTKEAIKIPATKTPVFKAGTGLKQAVGGK